MDHSLHASFVKAEPIQVPSAFPLNSEVMSVVHQLGAVTVSVGPVGGEATFYIRFADVFGLRILDEGDLLEFWPTCSAPRGQLYEVTDGGWFAQERLRHGFISAVTRTEVCREFLVPGCDDCVNVLALEAPIVMQIRAAKDEHA